MSLSQPISSISQVVSGIESCNLAVPASSTSVGRDVPHEAQRQVCDDCFNTVFSPDSFQKAWMAQFTKGNPHDVAYSYGVPSLRRIQRQRCQYFLKFRQRCPWCRLVCVSIKTLHRVHKQLPRMNGYEMKVYFLNDEGITILVLSAMAGGCMISPGVTIFASEGMGDNTLGIPNETRILITPKMIQPQDISQAEMSLSMSIQPWFMTRSRNVLSGVPTMHFAKGKNDPPYRLA